MEWDNGYKYARSITTEKKEENKITNTKQRKKTSNKIQKKFRLQHLKLDHTLLISKKSVGNHGVQIILKKMYLFLLV